LVLDCDCREERNKGRAKKKEKKKREHAYFQTISSIYFLCQEVDCGIESRGKSMYIAHVKMAVDASLDI
jgi:hypothetical protein